MNHKFIKIYFWYSKMKFLVHLKTEFNMKVIGIYEFNLMSDDFKAALLWDKGTFIMTRIENPYRISLYSLSDFFAEIWYNDEKGTIDEIRAFKSITALEPYFKNLKIIYTP